MGSLSSEFESEGHVEGGVKGLGLGLGVEAVDATRSEDWRTERRVKIYDDGEGELGDSCCFGTRTVDMGFDCVWKLHGGV